MASVVDQRRCGTHTCRVSLTGCGTIHGRRPSRSSPNSSHQGSAKQARKRISFPGNRRLTGLRHPMFPPRPHSDASFRGVDAELGMLSPYASLAEPGARAAERDTITLRLGLEPRCMRQACMSTTRQTCFLPRTISQSWIWARQRLLSDLSTCLIFLFPSPPCLLPELCVPSPPSGPIRRPREVRGCHNVCGIKWERDDRNNREVFTH